MNFQLLDVRVEDRYPRGLEVIDVGKLTREDFTNELETVTVEKQRAGCVALLFGRTEDGGSICVRVEGVRPCLYYKMEAGDTCVSLRCEIQNKLRSVLGNVGDVQVTEQTFAHNYGFEPDVSAPLGRRLHKYAAVTFPSLTSWRAACKMSKAEEFHQLQNEIMAASARLELEGESAREALVRLRRREVVAKEQWEEWKEEWENVEASGNEGKRARVHRIAQECFVHPITRFLQETNLSPSKWYRVPSIVPESFVSTCQYEVRVHASSFTAVERVLDSAYKTLYYDIETLGLEPEASEAIQVSMVVKTNEGKKTKYLVAVGTVAPMASDVVLRTCSDEKDLLTQVRCIVLREDPDFVVAYNGVNFDNRFLAVRAERLGVGDFFYMSRLALRPSRLTELRLNSSGMGDNLLRYFDLTGRANFDWYVKLKRDLTSEPSYKLNHFARTICGDHKEELAAALRWKRVSAVAVEGGTRLTTVPGLSASLASRGAEVVFTQAEWDAFGYDEDLLASHYVATDEGTYYCPVDVEHRAIAPLHRGTAKDRRRLGVYCVKDSDLLDDLNERLTMITGILQFAGVFSINPEWVYFRGQQVRFVSQLLRKVRSKEAVPRLLNKPLSGFVGEGQQGFEGATVNQPKRGFYGDRPVATLDWKSLYPSIMMAHNLCHSTHVTDPSLIGTEGVVEHRISPTLTTHFVSAKVQKGILPLILEELLSERSSAKKMVKKHLANSKACDDASERQRQLTLSKVFDGRQLALKVACNSIYGACGALVESGGKYPNMAISATVTHEGRQAMVIKKEVLPRFFPGIDIIYGDTDSVMVCFAGVTTVQECAVLAEQASVRVTEHFESLGLKPMELEFEKVYFPYLLENKKRYIGLKHEPTADGTMECKGIDKKGVETERKDTLPFVKECMEAVVDSLMYRRDHREAWRRFDEKMQELIKDRVPMEKLTLRKNLSSKAGQKPGTIAHAAVNQKRREREAGSEAAVNEQVEYVIVNGHKKQKTTELAEDPAYAKEHGLKLNRLWYFEHCVKEALGKIFTTFDDIDYEAHCKRYSAQLNAARLGVGSLKSFLTKRE